MKDRRILVFICGAFILGGAGGYIYAQHKVAFSSSSTSSQTFRENSPNYKFTNPLLLTQSNADKPSSAYASFQTVIDNYLDSARTNSDVSDVSVYFRDMNSGLWTGVNENDTYAPGSMLKVAIMMGYLSTAETNTGFLDVKYAYTPQIDEGQYFKPPVMLPAGTYSAGDLIKNMIIESDNTATLILANQNPNVVERVYHNLHLPDPEVGADFMSPNQYAVFWRVLYNGTYLSHDDSEEALDLLSLTTFNDGLVAGLPSGTRVAHKFGEHTDVSVNKPVVHELHDCGIVYLPSKDPYFLCVMTRGSDFNALEKVISGLSKLVYDNLPLK
jgi:beta-lactamase class A